MKIFRRRIPLWALPLLASCGFAALAWGQGPYGYCAYEDASCSSAGYTNNGVCATWTPAQGNDSYCYCAIDFTNGDAPIVYGTDPGGDCYVGLQEN